MNETSYDAWNSVYKSQQGNIGLGAALAYYTSKGFTVLIPLNDTQKYDLVVSSDGKSFKRVSVKTTRRKVNKKGDYGVGLRNTGGASGKSTVRLFDPSTCDVLFVLSYGGNLYEIPTNIITQKNTIVLNSNMSKYIVRQNWGMSADGGNTSVDGG